MKKIELEEIIAERICEAERLQIFKKASFLAEKHGRAYEWSPSTDAYGITEHYDTAWRIDFRDVSIDYKSDCWEGRKVAVKFKSALVFQGKSAYDRHHNEFQNPKIKSYVPGEWVGLIADYYANPHAMQEEFRKEREKEWAEYEKRKRKNSPKVSDKEMEDAEKNFGIKGVRQ